MRTLKGSLANCQWYDYAKRRHERSPRGPSTDVTIASLKCNDSRKTNSRTPPAPLPPSKKKETADAVEENDPSDSAEPRLDTETVNLLGGVLNNEVLGTPIHAFLAEEWSKILQQVLTKEMTGDY